MEGRDWATVSELRASNVSASIQSVLTGMIPSRHFPEQPTADVSSYVEQALRLGQKQPTDSHGFVFKYLERAVGRTILLSVIRPAVRTRGPMHVSPGLSAAFEDAFAIRRRTGGKDDYIGARHVLVSLITSPNRTVAEELGMAMQIVNRPDLNALLISFAAVLRASLEPNESLEEWASIMRERGHPNVAHALEAASTEHSSVMSEASVAASFVPNSSAQASSPSEKANGQPSPTHQPDPIARLRNDDPRSLEQRDIVGIDDAAEALARVIASKNFRPPLAVGVFGHWGSGKSFLMRRIEQEIDVLRKLSSPAFHSQIVEVRFNAWHYVDTSLWANLVGEIFETLDRRSPPDKASKDGILNRLTTARELTIASARDLAAKRQSALHAKEGLRRAEADFEANRSSVSQLFEKVAGGAKAAWVAASNDPEAKKLVEGVYGQSLPEMMAQWGDPQTALNSLQKDAAVWLAIRRDIGGRKPVLSCLAIFILLLTISVWGPSLIPLDFLKKVEQFNPFLLASSGFFVTAASWSARITRKAVLARDTVIAAVTGYKDASKYANGGETGLQAAREKLDAARLKVAAAQASLGEAINSQANAANELARDTPAERLRAFVRAKAGVDGPYRSQQGLIGTIRRDFADLSNLMSSKTVRDASDGQVADENFKKDIEQLLTDFPDVLTKDEIETLRGSTISIAEVEHLDRIILYIDDLDRCPPDKVIDVLQAVHLLMAFPLFVVIVAVDVRWLEAALEDRHGQFGRADNHLKALEYLEKIFQMAIWTQKFDADDVGQMIRSRLTGLEKSSVSEQRADTQGSTKTPGGSIDQYPHAINTIPTTKDNDKENPEGKREPERPSVNELLKITDEEIAFLERASKVLVMTPRRVLRLINSYQVARAALDQTNFEKLVAQKGYRAFAGLFALATAKPDHIHEIVSALGQAEDWTEYREAFRKKRDAVGALSEFENWSEVLEAEGVDLSSLRSYVDLTLRFSFVGPCLAGGS